MTRGLPGHGSGQPFATATPTWRCLVDASASRVGGGSAE
jgi:hypothetical protein